MKKSVLIMGILLLSASLLGCQSNTSALNPEEAEKLTAISENTAALLEVHNTIKQNTDDILAIYDEWSESCTTTPEQEYAITAADYEDSAVAEEAAEEPIEDTSVEESKPLSREQLLLGMDSPIYSAYSSSSNYYEGAIKVAIKNLLDGFDTARLGTNEVKIAVDILIPESVYQSKSDLIDKMDAIWEYMMEGKFSKYYSYSGGYVTIGLDEIEYFVNDAVAAGCFVGDFDDFDLNPQITEMTVFSDKMGITKEVAVSFITICDSYGIDWLDAGYVSILDRLS